MSNIDYLIYHGYAPVTLCRVYRQMPTVEYCFIFVAILGTKVEIHFFLQWIDGDNGYWWLSTVCCCEFPAITQWVWQGGLRKPDDCSRSMREMPRGTRKMPTSMREMPRSMKEMPMRVKDARRMADGCSVVHPYYYNNHDTWLQIYFKLQRATDSQGSLVECATTIPIHCMDVARIM